MGKATLKQSYFNYNDMNQKEIKAHFESYFDVIGEWVSNDELYLEYVPPHMTDGDEMPNWLYDEIVDMAIDEDGFGYGFAKAVDDLYGYGVGLLFVDDVLR